MAPSNGGDGGGRLSRGKLLAQLIDGVQQPLAVAQHSHAQLEHPQLVELQQRAAVDALRLVVGGGWGAGSGARVSGWGLAVFAREAG